MNGAPPPSPVHDAGRARPLRILTWHVHGDYLYYLSRVPHIFLLPVDEARSPGYGGRCGSLPWGDNVVEVPVGELRSMQFDCILFQSLKPYLEDQYCLLDAAQRELPSLYLEHDPPQRHPTNTRHPLADRNVRRIIHVTPFNALMWDNGETPVRVIEHGVTIAENVHYSGVIPRGIVVINHLARRGRRLGADIYEAARAEVPLDLVGMESAASKGGLGEIDNVELPAFLSLYRFYFHPVRWTSLGLAAIEAMMVGLATAELATVIRNGENGYIDTDPARLIDAMRHLIDSPDEAARMGVAAQQTALVRFNIARFVSDWLDVLAEVTTE